MQKIKCLDCGYEGPYKPFVWRKDTILVLLLFGIAAVGSVLFLERDYGIIGLVLSFVGLTVYIRLTMLKDRCPKCGGIRIEKIR